MKLLIISVFVILSVANGSSHFKNRLSIKAKQESSVESDILGFIDNTDKWVCKRGCERIDDTKFFVCRRCKNQDDDIIEKSSESPVLNRIEMMKKGNNEDQMSHALNEFEMMKKDFKEKSSIESSSSSEESDESSNEENENLGFLDNKDRWVCKKGCDRINDSKFYICRKCKQKDNEIERSEALPVVNKIDQVQKSAVLNRIEMMKKANNKKPNLKSSMGKSGQKMKASNKFENKMNENEKSEAFRNRLEAMKKATNKKTGVLNRFEMMKKVTNKKSAVSNRFEMMKKANNKKTNLKLSIGKSDQKMNENQKLTAFNNRLEAMNKATVKKLKSSMGKSDKKMKASNKIENKMNENQKLTAFNNRLEAMKKATNQKLKLKSSMGNGDQKMQESNKIENEIKPIDNSKANDKKLLLKVGKFLDGGFGFMDRIREKMGRSKREV